MNGPNLPPCPVDRCGWKYEPGVPALNANMSLDDMKAALQAVYDLSVWEMQLHVAGHPWLDPLTQEELQDQLTTWLESVKATLIEWVQESYNTVVFDVWVSRSPLRAVAARVFGRPDGTRYP